MDLITNKSRIVLGVTKHITSSAIKYLWHDLSLRKISAVNGSYQDVLFDSVISTHPSVPVYAYWYVRMCMCMHDQWKLSPFDNTVTNWWSHLACCSALDTHHAHRIFIWNPWAGKFPTTGWCHTDVLWSSIATLTVECVSKIVWG